MDRVKLLDKINIMASRATLDAEANILYRLAVRVEHHGDTFEPPLTPGELKLIAMVVKAPD